MFGVLLSADTASFSQVLTACIGAAIIVGIFILCLCPIFYVLINTIQL